MALRSMTGFGQGSADNGELRIEASIRGVNHRFLDSSIKGPFSSPALEQEVLRQLKQSVVRGRVDISIVQVAAEKNADKGGISVRVHTSRLQAAAVEIRKSLAEIGITDERLVQEAIVGLLRKEEFFEINSSAPKTADLELITQSFQIALKDFLEMRTKEGQAIEAELFERISTLEGLADRINAVHAQMADGIFAKLSERLKKTLQDVPLDEQRVMQEAASLADRLDISEELSRLRSHFVQIRDAISKNEGGKKIEFLLQEMGREINTCGSKSQQSEISQSVIAAKAELEKMREQIQNVE